MIEFLERLHPHEIGLNYMMLEWRSPLLDLFFLGLNFFDTMNFSVILISFVLFATHWKQKERFVFFLIMNASLNLFLKWSFMLPRPMTLDPTLGLTKKIMGNGGFPSGGAESWLIFMGILISVYRKHWWSWLCGGIFYLLICLSRLYIGAHFLSDVIGGFFIGCAILWSYFRVAPWVEKKIRPWGALRYLVGFVLLPLLLSFLVQRPLFSSYMFTLIGYGVGRMLYEKILQGQEIARISSKQVALRALYAWTSTFVVFYIGIYLGSIVLGPDSSSKERLVVSAVCVGLWLSMGIWLSHAWWQRKGIRA